MSQEKKIEGWKVIKIRICKWHDYVKKIESTIRVCKIG